MIRRIKKVHFVGIGGIGMSGLAEILLNLGYQVSGSDLQPSDITRRLEEHGAVVYEVHEAPNVEGASIVVVSAAVPESNVEVRAAQEAEVPVIPRSEMLADLMRMKPNAIAVGGTHGKTTTTSMISAVLETADIESTAIIGGILNRKGSNVCWGTGDYLVAEADEHDGSFLKLFPTVSVVTSVDAEHLEYYGTIDAIKLAFLDFINKVPFYGFSVICADDSNLRDLLPEVKATHITYGLDNEADVMGEDISVSGPGDWTQQQFEKIHTSFDVVNRNEHLGELGRLGRATIQATGVHNVRNALAAISVGLGLGMSFQDITEGLLLYDGVRRRLQVKGNIGGILVVEDYAHHPTEIAATLEAASGFQARRIISIFQPHLYSRTKFLCEEFARSLLPVDKLYLTEIYPAREQPMDGISAVNIARVMKDLGYGRVEFIADKNEVADVVLDELNVGDLVLVLGAGDIWKVADEIVEKLGAR